jgi:aspartyl-tRNA synthetase
MNNFRTHYAGEVLDKDIDSEVIISGWVKKHRDLGELIFMDIRDISGICQVVINNENLEIFDIAKTLKMEYVVSIKGKVRKRQDINPNIPTGTIEIVANEIELINKSLPTPISIENDIETSEETRMDYRYLDLRRPIVQEKLFIRSAITKSVRNFLDNNRFLEVETPILTKSTPEGARDYLVPSRVNHGEFYALPQSPQIYKNLLMIAGLDRYYQIVKCFRDEDLRAERQPEFTQIDIETSFLNEIQIREMIEKMLKQIIKDVRKVEIKEDFPIITYDYAMDNYGNDKPDLRFDLKIIDVKDCFEGSEFKVFSGAEYLRCLKIENQATKFSRKDIDKLEEIAKNNHAKGMAWIKLLDGELTGPIVKFLSEEEKNKLINKIKLKENDLVLFAADNYTVVCSSLSAVRIELGKINYAAACSLPMGTIVDMYLDHFKTIINKKRK